MKISFVASVVGMRNNERVWDLESFERECKVADDLGFYAAYTGERRGRGKASGQTAVTYNPDMACLYGLSKTTNLIFGSHVTLLPLHHPVRVAQDAVMVNSLFPGRFKLGVGAGYTKEDFDAFGVPLSERGKRMQIGMEAINAFIRNEPYEIKGPWSGNVPMRDPAMGDYPLEVLAGGWSVPGVKRAAWLSDGWHTGPIRTVTAEAELAALYREECAKSGRKPKVILMREAAIGLTDQEAVDTMGDYLLDYAKIYYERGNTYEEKYDPWVTQIQSAKDMTLEMVAPDRFLIGSIDTWLENLHTWKQTINPDEVLLRLRYFYGPPLDVALRSMDLISKHIIPEVASL
jgi:alkanesulfonate monooxygenase SsuD/methylene tetrahydromethanopterin reductase-like flavin-dependent oxidoreductase (luciferase family)